MIHIEHFLYYQFFGLTNPMFLEIKVRDSTVWLILFSLESENEVL
jgi:hypothetical protein